MGDRKMIEAGRERIAEMAEADGEFSFASEVRAGCWDHRRDVSRAIAASVVAPAALSHKEG